MYDVPKIMLYFIGTMLVLSCLTGGVLGAGVLVLLVAAEGIRRYTLPPLRDRRARREACAHVWGEVKRVKVMGEFYVRHCLRKCGAQMHCYHDGSEYEPGHDKPRSERDA